MLIFTNFVGRLGNLSSLKEFISFLATVSGDLSNITAPPFILASTSLAEFPSFWAEHPALFSAPASEPSPEKRSLLVLQNYLLSLQRQYYIGQPVKAGTKKPLNPFLGELFLCESHDPEGKAKVKVISEQVSHHPPTTAGYIIDEENGVRAEAYSTQETSLTGMAIQVKQTGHALVTIDKYNETHLLPFPDIWAKSLMTGSPYPELQGTYRIISSSGYVAELRFGKRSSTMKKAFKSSAGRNEFEAVIYQLDDSNRTPIYEVGGCWSESWEIHDAEGNLIEKHDLSEPKDQPTPIIVKPLEEQSPWESRRAWNDVATHLKSGQFSVALKAKSKLEEGQRQMRKKEKAEGREWETRFWTKRDVNSDSITGQNEFSKMVQLTGGSEDDAKRLVGTHGDWRFDHDKYARWLNGEKLNIPDTPTG